MLRFPCLLIMCTFLFSCGGRKDKSQIEKPERSVRVPVINSDSAFWFTKKQVAFGPRIPNTPAHKQTGDFLISSFKKYGATIVVQDFEATTFDQQKLFLRNIIASYFPEKQKRIVIASHWDTRPFADKDKLKPNSKFDGANDGASGVAIMLEMARTISQNLPPEVGVDFILFDGEDWGEKENTEHIQPTQGLDSWWCLGSQYWSKHKHKANYSAYYGVLLDMVGAKDARFFQEGFSNEYAPKIVEKVWGTASRLGYSSIFVRQPQGSITDDHYYVNENAKIPMIDIIPYDHRMKGFPEYHHTQKDNLSLISKETLQAVGNVLMNVIYYEE